MRYQNKSEVGGVGWGGVEEGEGRSQTPSYKSSYASVFMLTNKDGRNPRCPETSEVTFSSLPVSKYYISLWGQQAEDDF